MKILIFSDSHGNNSNIIKACKLHRDASYILHLGDGKADIEPIKDNLPKCFAVNGNYEDSFSFLLGKGSKNNDVSPLIEIDGLRIFMCHGHRQRVNYGMQNLIYSALENDADIALFGHTHSKYNKYYSGEHTAVCREKGLYIFNPGSISRPRDSIYPSYGILETGDTNNKGILLSHGHIK